MQVSVDVDLVPKLFFGLDAYEVAFIHRAHDNDAPKVISERQIQGGGKGNENNQGVGLLWIEGK